MRLDAPAAEGVEHAQGVLLLELRVRLCAPVAGCHRLEGHVVLPEKLVDSGRYVLVVEDLVDDCLLHHPVVHVELEDDKVRRGCVGEDNCEGVVRVAHFRDYGDVEPVVTGLDDCRDFPERLRWIVLGRLPSVDGVKAMGAEDPAGVGLVEPRLGGPSGASVPRGRPRIQEKGPHTLVS